MKENLKISNKLIRLTAAAIVGAGLATGCNPFEQIQKDVQNYECRTSMTCPPPDGIETRTRSFDDSFVKMDETLKWDTDKKRWQITDRKIEALPQAKTNLPIIDNYNAWAVETEMIARKKFFSEPTDKNNCQFGVWDRTGYGYSYCWDKDTNSWQEQSEDVIINTMR